MQLIKKNWLQKVMNKILPLIFFISILHLSISDGFAYETTKNSSPILPKSQSLGNRKDAFSFSIGVSFCKLKAEGEGAYNLIAIGKANYAVNTGFSAAVFRQFIPVSYRKNFKIGYGLRYHQMNADGNYSQIYSNGVEERYQFNFKFSAIEIPLYAKYRFVKNNLGFGFALGTSFSIFLTKSDKLHYEESFNGVQKRNESSGAVYLNRANGEGLMSSSFNTFAAFSLDIPIFEEQILFLETTYCPYFNIANSSKTSLYPTFTDLHLGMRF